MKTKKENLDNSFLINPLYYIKVLKSKSIWIILVSIAFLISGVFLVQNFIQPKYKATAKLIRYDKKISMPRDVPYKFQNFNYDTALQTIRTRKNLEQVIEQLNLSTTVEKLYSDFEIKRGRNSDIIEIRYNNYDIHKAVLGANILSKIFLQNFYEVQNAATKEIYNYYEKEKSKIQKELNDSLLKKEQFVKKNKILSIQIQKEYKYKQLNEIDLSLISAKVAQKEFDIKVEEIDKILKKMPKEVQLKYSVRSADRKNLEDKKKELRKLKQRYTSLNPKVKKVMDEISVMRRDLYRQKGKVSIPDETTYGNNPIVTALKIEKSKSKVGILASKTRVNQLEVQKRSIYQQMKQLNVLEKQFNVIESELVQKQKLMNKIIDRLSEVRMALESSLEDFKFLEKATPPKYAQKNYKKAIVLLFGLTGFSLSIAAFILLEFFNPSIKERFDLEKRFDVDVLGVLLNQIKTTALSTKYSLQFIDDFIAACQDNKEPKTILFGSDVSLTGKTFIIEKLMHLLSHQNKKVLYIQTVESSKKEIEGAVLNKALFKEKKINFSMLNKINETTYKAYILNDKRVRNDLLDTQKTQSFFDQLEKSDFDYIFIEISNSHNNHYFLASLGLFCHFVCLVCKYRVSNRKDLKELMVTLRKKGIKNIKGVLNVMDKKYI